MIQKFRNCLRSDLEKRDIDRKEKIVFCLCQQIKIIVLRCSNLSFMKQQLSF